MATTRITLQGPTTLWGAPPRPWTPNNNATALSYINSIEVVYDGTALSTFPGNRDGPRLWGTTDLPLAANGAAILSVDAVSAGRRAGGAAGSNYSIRYRDSGGGNVIGPQHNVPFAAQVPNGHYVFNDNFPLDPNGNVWSTVFINSAAFEFGLHQAIPAATGVSVSYIDWEVLWAGDSNSFIAVGISLLLPLLLPILGGMNLQHLNQVELAQVHYMVKAIYAQAGETTYPSIVLPEEREKLFKELVRPTYVI